MPAPSPPPEENDRAFSRAELAVARRAYARQMLAVLGVDNPAIEAALRRRGQCRRPTAAPGG